MGKPAPWARHSASRVPRQRSQEPSPFGARFVVRSHLPPPACQISYELFLDQVNYISTHMRAVSVCRASTGGGHPLAPRGANLGAVGDTALVPTRSSPPAGPERSQLAPGRDIAAIKAKEGQPSAQPRRVSAQPSFFRNDSSGGSKAAHATDQKELDPKRRHTPRPDTPQPARSRCCRRGGLQARPAGPSCCRDERTPRPIDRRGTRLTSAATHQVGPRKPKLGESASTEVQHLLSTRHRPAPFRPP